MIAWILHTAGLPVSYCIGGVCPGLGAVAAVPFTLLRKVRVDVALPPLKRQAIDTLDWGGQCILLGVPKLGTEASFVVNTLYNDKSIMGCRYGSARPHYDIPLFIDLYKAGKLHLDELVSAHYDLHDIQTGLDALHNGKVNRAVLNITR